MAASRASAEPAAREDSTQLQRKIERTREQLGQTVEQLAARADIKGRARDKAADVSGQVKSKAGQIHKQVAPVWDAAPEPVRQAVAKGASSARQRRVPLFAAVGTLVLGYLILRRLRRR